MSDPNRTFRAYSEVKANTTSWQKIKRLGLTVLLLSLPGCAAAQSSGGSTATSGTETSTPALTPIPTQIPDCIIVQNSHDVQEKQQYAADAFSDSQNASGVECSIPVDTVVPVDCSVIDPASQIVSARIYGGKGPAVWYQFMAKVGNVIRKMRYASNTAWNQFPAELPDDQRPFAKNIPICSDSPQQTYPPYEPPTTPEAVGTNNIIMFQLPDDGSKRWMEEQAA